MDYRRGVVTAESVWRAIVLYGANVILAGWAGHADGGTLAKRVCIHPDLSHLKAATSQLDELFG